MIHSLRALAPPPGGAPDDLHRQIRRWMMVLLLGVGAGHCGLARRGPGEGPRGARVEMAFYIS